MVCRLCLKYFEDLIDIFDANGHNLKMAEVVGQHLWFRPQVDDPISTAICNHCWLRLCDFHEFYIMVEKAQSHMTDGFMVKTEVTKADDGDDDTALVQHKCGSFDELDELGEVPFSMPLDDATDQVDEPALEDKETPRDILSNYDFSSDECKDEDESQNDNNSNDDKAFVRTINTRNKGNLPRNKQAPINVIKKTKRILNKDKLTENIRTIKRKRGRPKTREGKTSKPPKTQEEQDAYKAKMKQYDEQIAQYMPLYCEVCNTESENFPALRVHMRDSHNIKDGYVTCCEKKFNKRALLVYHIRHHLNPNCYRCEDCDFTFADRQSMHNHFLVKHQKEEDKLYECSECPKKFSRKYLLEQHNVFSHRGRISKCKNCNKRFKTPEELIEHNKDDCSAGTMCDICAKVIRGGAAFKRHQLEHQGVAIPKEQCDLCGLWYKDKRGLKRHRRKHMEAKEPHACDICQKVSPSRSAMLSHKRYAHGSERLYECSVCQKSFKKPLSLREHMTIHTGEVLYSCPHCTKTFNSNANMHSHRKKVHPREFEETRKLRKQNLYMNVQPEAPSISDLSNVKQEV